MIHSKVDSNCNLANTYIEKNLVNKIHADPNTKMKQGQSRKRISEKLKELGFGPSHTNAYVKNMNEFYRLRKK